VIGRTRACGLGRIATCWATVVFATACTSSSVTTSSVPSDGTVSSGPTTTTAKTTTTLEEELDLRGYLVAFLQASADAGVQDVSEDLASGTAAGFGRGASAIRRHRQEVAAMEPPVPAEEFHDLFLTVSSSQLDFIGSMQSAIADQDLDEIERLSGEGFELATEEVRLADVQAELVTVALSDIDTPTSNYLTEAISSGQQMRTDVSDVFTELQALLAGEFPGLDALQATLQRQSDLLTAASEMWAQLQPTANSLEYHVGSAYLIDGGADLMRTLLSAVTTDDPSAFGAAMEMSGVIFQQTSEANKAQNELLLSTLQGDTPESSQPIAFQQVPAGGIVFDLAVGSEGLVGVGLGGTYQSSHGIYWAETITSTLNRREAVETLGTIAKRDVLTSFGADLIALGGIFDDDYGLSGWRSVDGQEWEQFDLGASSVAELPRAEFRDAAASESGMVAVGCELSMDLGEQLEMLASGEDICRDGTAGPLIWFSADGSVWQRIEQPVATGGFTTVAAGPDRFVAAADDVWASADGIVWELIDDDALGGGRSVRAVSSGGPGFVAVGADSSGNPAIWTSADALGWTEVPLDDESFEPNHTITDVTAFDGGLVAVGLGERDSRILPAAWVSADGFSWEQIQIAEPSLEENSQSFSRVYVGGPGFIVLGFDDARPAIWVGYEMEGGD